MPSKVKTFQNRAIECSNTWLAEHFVDAGIQTVQQKGQFAKLHGVIVSGEVRISSKFE